jgi:uncharacterized iron-regulated membrane protein
MRKSRIRFPLLGRKLHRWGAVITLAPLVVIIVTGLLLLLKKEASWIQPPTSRGVGGPPEVTFERILETARTSATAGIESWEDIDRLDVRPDDGVVKVLTKGGVEVQIDTSTGKLLREGRRRSDLIESIHDGSWFFEGAKLWVFLPCTVILFGLWCSGVYLWLLPIMMRRKQSGRTLKL